MGIIGAGAIGSVVAGSLKAGRVPGCELAGVLRRSVAATRPHEVGSLPELLAESDVVVEAAGHEAVAAYGPAVLEAGLDLFIVSVGALADDALLRRLTEAAGPARLLISAGAIGGLGLFRAAALMGGLDEVRLVTTKPPTSLVASWMGDPLRRALESGAEPVVAFTGSARAAAAKFPESLNVAATLALATVGFDRTDVQVVGDPGVTSAIHEIHVAGPAGRYDLRVQNTPSANHRTSAVTPFNVVRALADAHQRIVVGV